MADKRMSEAPVISGNDVQNDDTLWLLDVSDNSEGPAGTWKRIPVSFLNKYRGRKTVVRMINFSALNHELPELQMIVEAINNSGPYTCEDDEEILFSIGFFVGQGLLVSYVQKNYYRVHNLRTAFGIGYPPITAFDISPAGNSLISPSIIDLGNIGNSLVQVIFNQGDDGNPWEITGETYVRAETNSGVKVWRFLGGDGLWGAGSQNAEDYHFLLVDESTDALRFNTVVHNLSTQGIDDQLPELERIAQAVAENGPFTCKIGQQMIFRVIFPEEPIGSNFNNKIAYKYFRLIRNVTFVGGPFQEVGYSSEWFMPDGKLTVDISNSSIQLNNIGSQNIWDVINSGKSNGEPYDMFENKYITGIQNSEFKVWFFQGEKQYYGGTIPDTNTATENDFFLINGQPAFDDGSAGTGASQEDELELTQDYTTIGTVIGDTQKDYNEKNEAIIAALVGNVPHPDYLPPTVSMTTPLALQKVGASYNVNLTLTYNQRDGGPITSQKIEKNGAQVSATNTFSETLNVPIGLTTYKGTVNYAQGPVKDNSIGIPDPVGRIPAGSKSVTKTIEGVYPLFATTNSITIATEQSLVSMKNANNVVLNLVGESGGNKQFFDIPQAWLDERPLTKIEFFDFNTNAWNSQNQLSTFTAVANTHTVNGNVIDYKRYTNNGSNRGSIRMRLIF